MANSYEHETESDEDCEVYFLKPVNEYNIVEKIKEANKELFGNDDLNDSDEKSLELMAAAGTNRKVSFAAHLEEYEPCSGINSKQLDEKLGKEDIECDEGQEGEDQKQLTKLDVIAEEEAVHEIEAEQETKMKGVSEKTQQISEDSKPAEAMAADDEAIEEICEEILIMDMENEAKTKESSSTDSPGTLQRKMLKQITFDYDEDEQDNKSLTNLLITDDEDEAIDVAVDGLDFNCNESLLDDTDNEHNTAGLYYDIDDIDEEEDDKLSIIVASYLPDDDFDCDKTSLTSDKCTHESSNARSRLPFNKRFSFKRKTTKSCNAVASCTSHNINNISRRFLPPPEVTDLKLHYKTCCEFKNAQQKLPKYTGYLGSRYGLSHDQLQEREQKVHHKQRSLLEQTLKTTEDEMRKMHDNERAFTKWLMNKMRFPINKTRNMFDVRRPFGLKKCTSVSGQAQDGDNNNLMTIPNTTRYRSISAKFKKAKP